jgi:hypothetical protein
MNWKEAASGAIASWTAAALCRFAHAGHESKAPEDWRSPKPGGNSRIRGKIKHHFKLNHEYHPD